MNAGLLKKEEIKKEAMWSPRESLRLRVVCYLLPPTGALPREHEFGAWRGFWHMAYDLSAPRSSAHLQVASSHAAAGTSDVHEPRDQCGPCAAAKAIQTSPVLISIHR